MSAPRTGGILRRLMAALCFLALAATAFAAEDSPNQRSRIAPPNRPASLPLPLGEGRGEGPAQGKEPVSIHWRADSADPQKVAVEVSGVGAAALERVRQANWKPEDWRKVLTVRLAQDKPTSETDLPAVLGGYSLLGDKIRFEPMFPLDRGVKYKAVFLPGGLPGAGQKGGSVSSTHELPAPPAKATTVVAGIYPTADLLPENLLKFYIHFSAPMRGGKIYDHIQLLDEKSQPVELPFLEIDEELWNQDMTRLTLFLDPGRIKRGVRPLEEVGPSLREGRSYTLSIKPTWQDGAGHPLRGGFEKHFRVTPPDREALDTAKWKIHAPRAATRDPLVLSFPIPLDHALALRMIRILDSNGKTLEGRSKTEANETRLAFIPASPWLPGPHTVSVQTAIEDLAGNNIGKPFEVDLIEGPRRVQARDTVTLPFSVR